MSDGQQPIRGIDIYHGDGNIDFAKAKAAGVQFVIAKATQGLHMVDTMYAHNRAQAKAHGLVFGAYHFFDPRYDGAAQADFFLAHAKPVKGDLIPTLDSETAGANVAQKSLDFALRMKKSVLHLPIIYCAEAFYRENLQSVFPASVWTLWLARYGHALTVKAACWQYTESGSLPGTNHALDLDVFSGSAADAAKYIL